MDDVNAGARWVPAFRALGDERLARMVEDGSDSAFSAIYGRYAPVLHGYCRSLLHDEEEAGDALQNAMLKALQAMRKAARTGPLRPWLFRIAHNESVTIIRQRSRRPGELDDNVVAGQADAFRQAVAREELAGLLRDLGHLTDHQRGALVMRELGGLSYDEIASALETSPLAARQAVFAAKRKLDPKGEFSTKRLKLLLPPAPAGLALFGLFGGGGGAAVSVVSGGGKGIVAAVAAASIGFGGVEIATHLPEQTSKPRTRVATATPTPEPKSSPRAQNPTESTAARESRAVKAVATPAAKRAAKATTAASFEPVVAKTPKREAVLETEAEPARERAERTPVATPAPKPQATPAPQQNVSRPTGNRHRGPGGGYPGQTTQAAPYPTASPAPATAPYSGPTGGSGPRGGYGGHQGYGGHRGGRGGFDAASVPQPSVAPVQ